MFDAMKGKVAFVTGATSGIGQACAKRLADVGVKVVLAGRNEEKGTLLEQELLASGNEALFVSCDVSSEESVMAAVRAGKERFGSLDFAVNSAGTEGRLRPITMMEEKDFDALMGTNLKGIWLSLKHELKEISKQGGAIVNIGAYITRKAVAGTGAYTASKSGVESLTKVAAIEWGKRGIRVNAIAPGAVDTPMLKRIYPTEKDVEVLTQKNPLGKIATAEEIADITLWLLSPLTSHVNGNVMYVDGGSSLYQ